ncbi:MAG TPA: aldehyde dehydrogenase family protein, partial [Pseudonocardiaceae bacterium]|nr:aldehyde dehydrogenase family protein [Pseudonocardiaceae bacterium]
MTFVDIPTELHIGGKDVPARAGDRFDVLDPATGDVIARVANAGVADAVAAVDAAHEAAAAWAGTAPRERAEILRAAFELMTSQADQYARLISWENGKALPDARGEVAYAAEFFRWYAEEAVRINGSVQTAPSGANRIMVTHQPVGVCVLVTPWNFP